MAYTCCLENLYIHKTLSASKRSDLAVVDTDGCEALVKSAVNRGVYVYGYLTSVLLRMAEATTNSLNLSVSPITMGRMENIGLM
jgi:hypothetical protein